MSPTTQAGNRLAAESSPYLRQHADNPVDWYPWGPEALELARTTDKPILLSIGYSACHWCHVMAHESFEDPTIAELMNRLFINIKVDREERPDIDKLYQTAHQLITQRSGGWPLTMFLTPDGELPFFGGTYFPDKPRHGMPGFAELLQKVAHYYTENPNEARRQGQALADIFPELEAPPPDSGLVLDREPIDGARTRLEEQFDGVNGGLGGAPKFPQAPSLERLLQHWRGSANSPEPDVNALYMAALSLNRMSDGGLFDHLGGGFFRYSVDAAWQIPHFEKMLYDNAPLLTLYSDLYSASGDDYLKDVASATADWMLRDMTSPEGAFYASLDADSDGGEGRYYVWDATLVEDVLTEKQFDCFSRRFGLHEPANFEGQWHLTVRESLKDLGEQSGDSEAVLKESLNSARATLLKLRESRAAPSRDEKILTSWNALAIRALATSCRALERPDLGVAATTAMNFIRENLYCDGSLLATYKDGQARLSGYLDDYAFTLDAALNVLQLEFDAGLMNFSCELADSLLQSFQDRENGGFFYTANDHEKLLHRARTFADDALPAGNGIAAKALTRLGYLLGENRYLDAAERTLRAAWAPMSEYPHGHITMVSALDEFLSGTEIVVIRGDADEIQLWASAAAHLYAPRRLIVPISASENNLPDALRERVTVNGGPTAYVCRGHQCSLPAKTFDELAKELSGA